jgi:hypothetical protein
MTFSLFFFKRQDDFTCEKFQQSGQIIAAEGSDVKPETL